MTANDRKIKDISLILKDLLKVIKIVSMYPEDNPLPQSMRRTFSEKLESIVDDYGELKIEVQAQRLVHSDVTVFQSDSKEENLAGIFFNAGITEITFKASLEVLDVYKLLDVIKCYLNAPDRTQDLAALIWEAGIRSFGLKTLEDVALTEYNNDFDIDALSSEGSQGGDYQEFFGSSDTKDYQSIFSGAEDSSKWETCDFEALQSLPPDHPAREFLQGDNDPESQGSGPQQIGLAVLERVSTGAPDSGPDAAQQETAAIRTLGPSPKPEAKPGEPLPNSTLILNDGCRLSAEEEQFIRGIIEEDASFDPYTSTIELLQEILLQETELPGFSETVTICEKILGEYLRHARLAEAGNLLENLRNMLTVARKEKPAWADRLKEAFVAAGSRGRLEVLARSLNDNPDIGPAELQRYLNNFGWEALTGITEMVGQLEHAQHRNTVLGFLSERGKENLDLIAKGVSHRNLDVVRNAMSVLAEVASDKAVHYLGALTKHSDEDIRRHLVLLLRDCDNENVIPILKQMVHDSDAQIRCAAVNSIVSKRGQPAFDAITDVINDEKFPSLDEDDQQALLCAFSTLGGERAVSFLSELITTFNHFHSRTLTVLRRAAFEALIVNRSHKAEQLLFRLSKNWRPDIRNQALSALQRRREIPSGDSRWKP